MFGVSRHAIRGLVALLVMMLLATSLVTPASAQIKEAGQAPGNEYVSPSHGMTVEWDDPWIEVAQGVQRDSANTPEYEYIQLQPASGEGSFHYLSIFERDISFQFRDSGRALDHFEESMDQAALEALFVWADSVEVLDLQRTDTQVAALIYAQMANSHTLEIREVRIDADAEYAIDVSLSTPVEVFADWYEDAQRSVEVDGERAFTFFDDDDVLDVADGIPAFEGGDRDPIEDEDVDSDLADVRDHFDELSGSVDEFVDLLSVESLSQRQADRANEILGLWLDAPSVASRVQFSSEHADIEDAYLDYTSTLADAAGSFIVLLDPDSTEAQVERAVDDFQAAISDATTLEAELDDLLVDAGA